MVDSFIGLLNTWRHYIKFILCISLSLATSSNYNFDELVFSSNLISVLSLILLLISPLSHEWRPGTFDEPIEYSVSENSKFRLASLSNTFVLQEYAIKVYISLFFLRIATATGNTVSAISSSSPDPQSWSLSWPKAKWLCLAVNAG